MEHSAGVSQKRLPVALGDRLEGTRLTRARQGDESFVGLRPKLFPTPRPSARATGTLLTHDTEGGNRPRGPTG